VRDHVTLGDGANGRGLRGRGRRCPAKTAVGGIPSKNNRQFLRELAAARRLPELIQQVREIQEQLKKGEGEVMSGRRNSTSQKIVVSSVIP